MDSGTDRFSQVIVFVLLTSRLTCDCTRYVNVYFSLDVSRYLSGCCRVCDCFAFKCIQSLVAHHFLLLKLIDMKTMKLEALLFFFRVFCPFWSWNEASLRKRLLGRSVTSSWAHWRFPGHCYGKLWQDYCKATAILINFIRKWSCLINAWSKVPSVGELQLDQFTPKTFETPTNDANYQRTSFHLVSTHRVPLESWIRPTARISSDKLATSDDMFDDDFNGSSKLQLKKLYKQAIAAVCKLCNLS